MLQDGVARDVAFGVEAHEHLQVAAKAQGGRLYGDAEWPFVAVLCLVDDVGVRLSVVDGDGVGAHDGQLLSAHDGLDACGQRLLSLKGDGTFSDVIHPREDAGHEECGTDQDENHISQR